MSLVVALLVAVTRSRMAPPDMPSRLVYAGDQVGLTDALERVVNESFDADEESDDFRFSCDPYTAVLLIIIGLYIHLLIDITRERT